MRKSLLADQDPVIETIMSLELWVAKSGRAPNKLYTDLGYTAFETVLFATRHERIKQLIGEFTLFIY